LPVLKVALCAGIIAGLSIVVGLKRLERPYLLVGWFWYVAMLLPVIGLIQAGRQGMGDRFTYWPMIGIVWALVWLGAEWLKAHPSWRWQASCATASLIVLLAAAAWHQLGYWRDSVTLFEHALAAG